MLKCSHFEEYMGYKIIINYIKELKSKEIRPTFVPTYPPLGTNGRWNWISGHIGSHVNMCGVFQS